MTSPCRNYTITLSVPPPCCKNGHTLIQLDILSFSSSFCSHLSSFLSLCFICRMQLRALLTFQSFIAMISHEHHRHHPRQRCILKKKFFFSLNVFFSEFLTIIKMMISFTKREGSFQFRTSERSELVSLAILHNE